MDLEVEQDLVEVLKVVEIHLEQDFETVAVETVAVSEIVVEIVEVDAETDGCALEVDELIDEMVDEVVDEEHEEVDVETDAAVDVVDAMMGEVLDARDIRMGQVPAEHNFHLVK